MASKPTWITVWSAFLNRQFSPTTTTLANWAATRKLTKANQPGIYNSHNELLDNRMYWTAFILEIFSSLPIVFAALSFGGILPYLVIIGTLIGFFLDVRIGVFLRRNSFTHNTNTALLSIANLLKLQPSQIANLQNENSDSKSKLLDWGGITLLIVIALLKTLFFIITGWPPTLYVGAGFIYLFVAYIHINHTGFRYKYVQFRDSLMNDYMSWVSSGGQINPPSQHTFQIVLPAPNIRPATASHLQQQVAALGLSNANNNIQINYLNVLDDNDAFQLSSAQVDNNSSIVRQICLAAQLNQIGINGGNMPTNTPKAPPPPPPPPTFNQNTFQNA